jgi:hypothetical protein
MPGHLGDGHKPAQLINVKRQALGDTQIRIKQLQIFDTDMLTMWAKQLAVLTADPHFGRSQVQISHAALTPAVHRRSLLTAKIANGLKAFVGFYRNARFAGIGENILTDNFDSTKGEIRCYSDSGHRRPPLDNDLLCRHIYYP